MQYLRRIERVLAITAPATLRVANGRGDLVVIGEDRDDVAFVAQVAVDARDEHTGRRRLDEVDIPLAEDADGITIGPPAYPEADEHEQRIDEDIRAAGESFPFFGFRFGGGGIIAAARRVVIEPDVRVDMEVRVPRWCAVAAELRAGALRVAGVHANVSARGRSGRVEIREIVGDVSVETRSGQVDVRAVAGSVGVDARSGRVTIGDAGGDVTVESRSGRIDVRRAGGRTSVRGHAGSVRVEDANGPVEIVTHTGSVELAGGVAHAVEISVYSGSVRLAVPADARFYLDAESRLGSVRSDLPVGAGERPEGEAPTVRVRTEVGSVRIVPL